MIFLFNSENIIKRYRPIGYNINVMRQSACLVFNPITVDYYAAFFKCTPVGRASDSMLVGAGVSCLLLSPQGFNRRFSLALELVSYWAPRDLHCRAAYSFCESSFLIHHGIYHYLFVCP